MLYSIVLCYVVSSYVIHVMTTVMRLMTLLILPFSSSYYCAKVAKRAIGVSCNSPAFSTILIIRGQGERRAEDVARDHGNFRQTCATIFVQRYKIRIIH
jgi:hypothetical protein